jgi:DNA-directed RNA polymerase specialized sigma24 family protein
MPADPKQKLRKAIRAAQERYEGETEAARRARREAFTKAQRGGLSLREIAEEVGLHRSRVGQIISGK